MLMVLLLWMNEMKVYLAGPIAGLSYNGATAWRDQAKRELNAAGIQAFSPMRAKQYLKDVASFSVDGDVYKTLSILSCNRGITTRDRYDCTTADVVLVNVLGAERISIGTVLEVAWADAARIPIVLVMEPEGNVHHHGMILECTGFHCHTLDEALSVVKAILLEGTVE